MENPAIKALQDQIDLLNSKISDAKIMQSDPHIETEMIELVNHEIEQLNTQVNQLESAKNEMMNMGSQKSSGSTDNAGTGDCIVEIRAGTGGDEAGLFAGNLFTMYSRYAESKKWKVEVISKNEGGIGNIKEISFQITGKSSPSPFEMLQYESGVHRVQRVPVTESGGRIHTSTATVAVLPIVGEREVNIRTEDLRVDTFRAGGKGGQHVNKTESAIRITHIPTGVVAQCQDERSQFKNRERAMSMLRSKLFEMMKRQEKTSLDDLRSDQVGTGERSEKIRTYNFPQDRITDHRIKESWFGMERILSGEIDKLINDVRTKMIENPDLKSDEE